MDDILPIFLFILVRARIPSLRSEVQILFDFFGEFIFWCDEFSFKLLMNESSADFDHASGQQQFMLITLEAGFFQLLQESDLSD